MPDLRFTIESAGVVQHAAIPTISFQVRVINSSAEEVIHTIALRAQIQIEASRRTYDPDEQAQLLDLFGEPKHWGQTVRTLLWTHATAMVPSFKGITSAELPVPCTFDFNVAATKYFHGLTSGELPLCFQFSGMAFYRYGGQTLQVSPIAWDKEARFRLPVEVWKDLMDLYYPNTAWLAVRRDTFEKLQRYKVSEGIPTWDEVLERAVKALPETVRA